MTPAQARIRSAATLIGMVVLLLLGVVWAWSAVSEPFPEREEAAICSPKALSKGDKVYPDQVTVSVLNAGDREGLADRTMTALEDAGLSRGELGNAPEDAAVNQVQIWSEDLDNPGVRLVKSYLGKAANVVRRDAPLPGVNVVVGEDFPGVIDGRTSYPVEEDTTICSPPEEEAELDLPEG
jgi:hypothetical protein